MCKEMFAKRGMQGEVCKERNARRGVQRGAFKYRYVVVPL
jgi:hypothetical protein